MTKVFSITEEKLTLSIRKPLDEGLLHLDDFMDMAKEVKEEMEDNFEHIKKEFPGIEKSKFNFYENKGKIVTFYSEDNKIYCMVTAGIYIKYFIGKEELKLFLKDELYYSPICDSKI